VIIVADAEKRCLNAGRFVILLLRGARVKVMNRHSAIILLKSERSEYRWRLKNQAHTP
jgi:hypothetical protein